MTPWRTPTGCRPPRTLSWAALELLRRPRFSPWWSMLAASPLMLGEANRHERLDLGGNEPSGLIVLTDRVLPA